MDFIRQYLKIVNYMIIGFVFTCASFYLYANIYHYLEISKVFSIDFSSQPTVVSINEKLNHITENVFSFNQSSYKGNIPISQLQVLRLNLNSCVDKFNNKTIQAMYNKDTIDIVDVYYLRESYENDILNDCIISNLFWLTTTNSDSIKSNYLVNNRILMRLYIDSLRNETSYLKKDLINNSSYFFGTSIASSSVKDNTKDGFYEVIGAYDKAASFVEFVSEWFKNEMEGNYD